MKRELDLTESSDFQYLLELMLPLYKEPAYAWLPELFSIIGHDSLIKLCKVAGGEKIKIPTLTELSDAVQALDWYYNVWITKKHKVIEIPPEYHDLVFKIGNLLESEVKDAQ